MIKRATFLLTSSLFLIVPLVATGDDWPWWRGPNFDGKAVSDAPLHWSENRNVIWKVKVPGQGHSSPIVAGDRIYLTTADEKSKTQSALCYDRDSGRLLWSEALHQGGFMTHHPQNSQASPSAAFDGKRSFFVFSNAEALHISALDLQGQQLWRQTIGPFGNHEGYGTSPVIYKELVIVIGDNRRGSFLVALNRQSGQIVWRQDRKQEANFCTPVIAQLAGREQLLVSGLDTVKSYNPATGELLWHCQGPNHSVNSVAFSDDDKSYVLASGGVPEREILCIRADGSGDVSQSHLVWRARRNMPYVPSPVYHDGHFYLLTDSGIAQCLAADSGKAAWRKRLGDRFKTSLTLVGNKIYAMSETGTTHIFAAQPTFERLAENTLSEGTVSTPAICGGRIYLRTYHHLYCIGDLDVRKVAASLGPRTVEFPAMSYNGVHHVSVTTGSDETGNGSRDKPWKTIRHGLASVKGVRFDSRHAVVVAAGVYHESPIAMRSDIDLYGGFNPAGWKRDIGRHITVLEGDQRERVLIGANSTRLDGFTVTGGRCRDSGGGLLIENTAMTVSNNVFADNGTLAPQPANDNRTDQPAHNGGAIACYHEATPAIKHNLFTENFTEVGQGGAIAFLFDGRETHETTADVRSNVFLINNSGKKDTLGGHRSAGGAISCAHGVAPLIEHNVFVQNQAGKQNHAGAIHIDESAAPVIRTNWIVGNSANGDGGAIYVARKAEPLIERNLVMGNATTHGHGGAIRINNGGRAHVLNNVLAHATSGGAIQCAQSWMKLVNNTVVANQGGNVHYTNETSQQPTSRLWNNILENSTGPALTITGSSPPEVSHCVISGGFPGPGNLDVAPNFVDDAVTGTARVAFNATVIESTCKLDTSTVPMRQLVEQSLAGRPIRVVPSDGSDEIWGVIRTGPDQHGTLHIWGDLRGQPADNSITVKFFIPPTYHLSSASPCIGKGLKRSAPKSDLDGESRITDSDQQVDIGADEF